MTKVIGLTGGIASGKSTVAQMLTTAGLPIIDADQVVHRLQQPGEPGVQALQAAFGSQIMTDGDELNRAVLGQMVFGDDQQLAKLNAVMQPMVWDEIWRQVDHFRKLGVPFVVLDVPLLIEEHYDRDCGVVVVVAVDRQTQMRRLMARNNLTTTQAAARIASQMPLANKKRLADVVIDNNGDQEKLRQQVQDLVNRLKTGKMW